MQIRYGVVNDAESGPASAGGLDFVPSYRRTRAWVVSLCNSPRPAAVQLPPGAKQRGLPLAPDGGLLVVYIADTPHPELLTGWYLTSHSSNGLGGLGVSSDNPPPERTPFISVPWQQVARRGNTVLIRYHPRHCYTLDHVVISGEHRDVVSVILSGGPASSCPAPSAIAPDVEITTNASPLKHGQLGKEAFEPMSA